MKKYGYLLLAVSVAAGIYGWALWYCGGLYRAGSLLSAQEVTAENFSRLFCQHLITAGPQLAILAGTARFQPRKFTEIFGSQREEKRGYIAVCLAGTGYLLLLWLGSLWGKASPLSVLYQWGYYLIFVALAEEAIFRGLLPWLVQKSGLPAWCVWVIPGVLFGCMHTLMPVIQQGLSVHLLGILASSVLGYLAYSCGAYALRRWAGILWLPILLHAALDFTAIFA